MIVIPKTAFSSGKSFLIHVPFCGALLLRIYSNHMNIPYAFLLWCILHMQRRVNSNIKANCKRSERNWDEQEKFFYALGQTSLCGENYDVLETYIYWFKKMWSWISVPCKIPWHTQWRTQDKISRAFKVTAGLVGGPGGETPVRRRVFENLQKEFLKKIAKNALF